MSASQLAGAAFSALSGAAGSAAEAAMEKAKGVNFSTDQLGIPGAGMAAQYVPKSVSDQLNSIKGSSVVTGESHFLEVSAAPALAPKRSGRAPVPPDSPANQ